MTRSTLRPQKKERAAEFAVNRLQAEIRAGRYRSGDRLPPERELAELFGVSRPTVREAIQSLAALNIVEIRHGSGTYVAPLELQRLLAPLEFAFDVASGSVAELFELRLAIEPYAARLAAIRASDIDVARIDELARRSGRRGVSRRELVDVDVRLHTAIVEAARNEFLVAVHRALAPIARQSREITSHGRGATSEAARSHRAIADAIRGRDPGRADTVMRSHLEAILAAIR